jgi:hypothetical protein
MSATGGWGGLVPRRATCARCEARLDTGDAVAYAAIWQQEDGLKREDLCGDCFGALTETPYYHWRCAKKQDAPQSKRQRDVAAIEGLFERLGEDAGGAAAGDAEADAPPSDHEGLRYLLALELVRRRRLELVDLARRGGADCLVVRAGGDAELITLPAPALGEQELMRLGRELSHELGLGPEEAKA